MMEKCTRDGKGEVQEVPSRGEEKLKISIQATRQWPLIIPPEHGLAGIHEEPNVKATYQNRSQ
jgi:hypothetical protein